MATSEVPRCIFQLQSVVQNYAWGKLGSTSEVALLYSQNSTASEAIEETKPYAELWMGTHPKGANYIISEDGNLNILLSEYLKTNPELLGSFSKESKNGQLPFLFKVLSVNKPLSIQAHPNKENAAILHSKYPDKYPDDNHKPEIAIALTPFKALCGFRPQENIVKNIKETPELLNIITQPLLDKLQSAIEEEVIKSALKECFTRLFQCDEEFIKLQLTSLINRIDQYDHPLKDLILSTYNFFPGDVGCFCILFLNYLTLEPGESIFLAANEPHAYLYGDCIECMACSDNVVRAGLTPKYIDKLTLCEMLTYNCRPAQENKFICTTDLVAGFISIYNPPIKDFSVRAICPKPPVVSFCLIPIEGPSILLVTRGSGKLVEGKHEILFKSGSVIFAGAKADLYLFNISEDLVIYQAYYE